MNPLCVRHRCKWIRPVLLMTIGALTACAPVAARTDGALNSTAASLAPDEHGPPPPTTAPDSESDQSKNRERVVLGKETFHLERAVTGEERARGLMGRESIPANGGMLFVYPDAQIRSMWMANCLIDMDIIFLDRTGRILTGYTMTAEPLRAADEPQWRYEARLPRYRSIRPAQFAIELKAGTVKRLGLKAGDRIALDLRGLKKRAK